MELIYSGKTKEVYKQPDGNILFKFKDDGTVNERGEFDPGGNTVGVTVAGMGNANLRLTEYFFKKIAAAGVETQFISADIGNGTMTVLPVTFLGRGIEVLCRFKATGSFIRRYGDYVEEGQDLPAVVEFTIKDDERGDPPINRDVLEALDILKPGEYEELVTLTQKISRIIQDEISKAGGVLYDIKLEFGRYDGKIILVDEISAGSMRVYKNDAQLLPFALARLMQL